MAESVLRFGMVGSGYMAKMHSLALRNVEAYSWPDLPKIEMARMADISPEAAETGSRRWGWREACTDYREVTRADDVNVVVIITPNSSHAEIAIDAFKHGKHVLCEKPLADSVEAAERMKDAADKSRKVGLVNFVYRAWPGVELARQLIAEGEIGEILHVDGHFFQDYAADPGLPFSWRFDKKAAGAGAFGDIGSHITDIACALAGPIARLSAISKRIHEFRPGPGPAASAVTVEDLTSVLVEFTCGAVGALHASWAATGRKCDLGFFVTGTKGSLRFDWERSNELHFFSSSDPQRTGGFRRIVLGGVHPGAEPFWYAQGQGLGYAEGFVITLRRLIEAVLKGDTAVRPSFHEALHISHVVDAALRSADQRVWINVPPTKAFA
jgi:predicted dehydrogenase